MFNLNEEKLTDEQIMNIAIQDDLPPLRVAINANGYRHVQHLWGQPDASEVYRDEALGVLIKLIRKMARNGKGVVGVKSVHEAARKVKPFEGRNGIMARIKDELIPALDKMNVTCLIGDKVYVHSAIIDEYWQPNFKTYEGEHTSRLPYHLLYSEGEVEMAVEFYRKAKSLLNGK
ncbi:hypothetical protein HOR61_gp21 [Escherichia phage vB_EcoS-IME253]|uniref:Uncharacterized protein n=1 Tax=Escherichia phage vB_EcoS-IME253 TaxID=1933412 RepID=A0A1P8DUN6_9CAUD|nr:hypothetical protein HOR61_gp21 [Escherichia phage vB_EcoS-IME253]APU93221.1 hypothetical protein [Escherichia phage vB_EcoS-IME253]